VSVASDATPDGQEAVVLLWLEEAVVEAAMILAVVVGTTLFILATWSALADWLGQAKGEGSDDLALLPENSPRRDSHGRAA
jgi:hypothetical protein